MKIRTCPHCNYKYSISEYVKTILLKVVFSEWDCKNCNKKITFDFKRRVILALCFGAFYAIFFFLVTILKKEIGMSLLLWICYIVLFIIGAIYIFTFDTFKKVE